MTNVEISKTFVAATEAEVKTFEESSNNLASIFRAKRKLTVLKNSLFKQTRKYREPRDGKENYDVFGFPCMVENTTVQLLAKGDTSAELKEGQSYELTELEYTDQKTGEKTKYYRLKN